MKFLSRLISSVLDCLSFRFPLLIYGAAWTALLTLTVAVASFSPEVAFVAAISPSSSFSDACRTQGLFRVPLDLPGETLCLPAHMFTKSRVDLLVPPIFASVVVAASALVVRAVGLMENDAGQDL